MTKHYEKIDWQSQILDIDDNGHPIPLLDNQGNQLYDIYGNKKFKLLREGTRHTEKRENHREEGIYNAHVRIDEVERENQRLRIEMEMITRAPGSSGVFFDDFSGDESSKFVLDKTKVDIIEAVAVGATVLKLDSIEGFKAFTQVSIFDDTNSENKQITAIDTSNKTITVQALQNAYKKGAKVARSTVSINTVNKQMNFGTWDTYKVEVI